MIKVNTMIAVMEMIEIEDEGLIPIRIADGGDVSIGIGIGIGISIRKEERPNFPSPIPPPPYLNLRWRWSRKMEMEINGFTLYLYLKLISPGDFSFPPRFRFSGPLIPFPWSVS